MLKENAILKIAQSNFTTICYINIRKKKSQVFFFPHNY